MIEIAQRVNQHFKTLILSGYQEFDYVRRSLTLGVKNYLVKPVDKEELKKCLRQIKEELDEEQAQARITQQYFKNSLIRWLKDELNEKEFFQLIEQHHLEEGHYYTALKITAPVEQMAEISAAFAGNSLLIEGFETENVLLVIFLGPRKDLFWQLYQLQKRVPFSKSVIVGETVSEWDNLYESYEKIQQLETLAHFYPDLMPEKVWSKQVTGTETPVSMLSFNKALMIGDRQTIIAAFAELFLQLRQGHYPPEYVRYVSFLIYSDIIRQYPQALVESSEEMVEKIRQATQIIEVEELLTRRLATIGKEKVRQQFAPQVEESLQKITKDYQTEWTLKMMGDQLHLNPVYFGQLFKKETGKSFLQYVNQLRVKKAQQLLLNSPQNINEISEALGYNNTNYFSKIFKKLNGLTPKEFREKYAQGYTPIESEELLE